MRWTPLKLANRMRALLSKGLVSPKKQKLKTVQDIREAMLRALGDKAAKKFPTVQLRVACAEDVHDLWYLRGDVMAAIAAFDGEVRARKKIAAISEMFDGLIPRTLSSRSSPLGR